MSIQVSGEAPNRVITIEKEQDNWLMEAVEYCLSAAPKRGRHGSSYLDDLYAKEQVIFGTDGNRLHLVRVVPIPDGSYVILSKNKSAIILKETDGRAPRHESIIAIGNERKEISLPMRGEYSGIGAAGAYTAIVRALSDPEITVRFDFIDSALATADSWKAYLPTDPRSSIILKTEDDADKNNRLAVVMPQGI
jgi:hypothetical protein